MDTKKLNLAMNILKFTIAIIGAIACVWVLATSPGSDATEIAKKEYAATTQMSLAIYYTIIVIVFAIAVVLIFFFLQLITNTKKTVGSIIGIVVAALVYAILRMIGTTDTNASLGHVDDYIVSDATLSATTAGLYTVIIGIVVAILLWFIGPFVLGKYRK